MVFSPEVGFSCNSKASSLTLAPYPRLLHFPHCVFLLGEDHLLHLGCSRRNLHGRLTTGSSIWCVLTGILVLFIEGLTPAPTEQVRVAPSLGLDDWEIHRTKGEVRRKVWAEPVLWQNPEAPRDSASVSLQPEGILLH